MQKKDVFFWSDFADALLGRSLCYTVPVGIHRQSFSHSEESRTPKLRQRYTNGYTANHNLSPGRNEEMVRTIEKCLGVWGNYVEK
ncbi:hypothetical protein TNCV_1303211 [Trichonephila clavipes]|nr:hypothetical protein TNCV_1303211 [Trichonephila clavipes]